MNEWRRKRSKKKNHKKMREGEGEGERSERERERERERDLDEGGAERVDAGREGRVRVAKTFKGVKELEEKREEKGLVKEIFRVEEPDRKNINEMVQMRTLGPVPRHHLHQILGLNEASVAGEEHMEVSL